MTELLTTQHQNKIALLFSGGLDSLICYYYLKERYPKVEIDLLYFNLGHRYNKDELKAIKSLESVNAIPEVKKYNFLKLGMFEKDNAQLPLRNLYLIMAAANLGYSTITLVVQKGERKTLDKTRGFFSSCGTFLEKLLARPLRLLTPFSSMDKTDIVKWYKDSNLPLEYLRISSSCYTGKGSQCGKCPACYRKAVALRLNGIDIDFMKDNPILNETGKRYLANIDSYDKDRRIRIKKAYKLERGF